MTIAADTCDGLGDSGLTAPAVDLPPDVPALRRFYLYLSAGCNLHCRHCWITPTFVNGRPAPGECIDFELLKAAVAEAKPMGLVAAKLTGGEPVLHPEFLRIADFLTEENLDITLETNATLIDQAMARHLREKTKLSHIAVSLDSPDAEQHDRFRGVRGAFDAAVCGFGHLVSAGFQPQIIMSVDRENADRIDALIELAIGLGAGSVKFNPVTPSGRGAEIHRQGQALGFDELLELSHRIRGPLQDRYAIHLTTMVPPALMSVRELLCTGGDAGCCNVVNILGILGTGEMALCGIGRNLPELCFGMLGKDSLREVWTAHPALRRLRQDLAGPFPGVCGDCLHAGRCLTHCLAMNYEATGRLVNVSPLCAEAERRGQFPPNPPPFMGQGATGRMNPSGADGLFLHASSVVVNGGALLFLGHSSAGKSTIASLLGKTYPILADDLMFASSDLRGIWRVMDGKFRFENDGMFSWEEAVRRGFEYRPVIPLLGCLCIHKAQHVEVARLAPVEAARCLMGAVMEVDLQGKFVRLLKKAEHEKFIVARMRRMRKHLFYLAAEIARACPGWHLWFPRDSHFPDLLDAISEVAAQARR